MFYKFTPDPLTFSFLLIDNFSMMSLSSAVEPLRSANRLLGREAFRWWLTSVDGAPVTASNGIEIGAMPIAETFDGAHALFVCGGMRIEPAMEKRFIALLRLAAHRGLAIGSLSTGSQLLAKAGLLDGYRSTIHWENIAAFEEDFPDVLVTRKLYEIDRNRLTCSGGTAAMDMMLHIIADRYHPDLARGVANQFHHERIRNAEEEQRSGSMQRPMMLPPALRRIVEEMGRELEDPLKMGELAGVAGLSTRQMERLFHRYFGKSPAQYYLSLRIERARELLLYTDRSVLDVAVAVGFASTSHFAQWFRRFHGTSPSDLRKKARQSASPRA